MNEVKRIEKKASMVTASAIQNHQNKELNCGISDSSGDMGACEIGNEAL